MPIPLAVPLALGAIRVGAAVLARSSSVRAVSAAKIAVQTTTKASKAAVKAAKNPTVKSATVNAKAAKGTGKLATAVVPALATSRVLGLARLPGNVTGLSALAGSAAWYLTNKKKKTGGNNLGNRPLGQGSKKGGKGGDSASGTKKTPNIPTPDGFKFNLPPHNWSLPTRPQVVIPGSVNGYAESIVNHGLRRGRLWYFDNAGIISTYDYDTGKVSSEADKAKERLENGDFKGDNAITFSQDMYKYGFQFLWNPESISLSVNRNMEVTPTAADVYTSVSGAFPGQESISFTVILDRTNDMACIRSLGGIYPNSAYKQFADYYNSGKHPLASNTPSMEEQIEELARIGTMHDIEYLLKAINGDGVSSKDQPGGWKNLLGKKTADIGYLQPSLLAFEFGGDPLDPTNQSALSYVGWISSLSINHTAFTEGMVPIRSTVSVAFDCFAGSAMV
jgi:hypothetical protein